MMYKTRISTLFLLSFGLASGGVSAQCKTKVKSGAFIYAVGSSTLGSPLGPQLKSALTAEGFQFRKWAKASSGLARPDFHDWPDQIPSIEKEWNPDVFIVSLGTNDYQAIFKKKRWINPDQNKKWIETYTARVDRMLKLAAGKDKKRLVVWVGPVPFDTKKGRNLSLRINRILKERIAAFDGHAVFVDMRSALMKDGRPIKTFKDAKGKKWKTYRKDKVHLTIAAVKHLITKRVVKAITDCRR